MKILSYLSAKLQCDTIFFSFMLKADHGLWNPPDLFFYKFYCAKIIYNMYKSKVYKTVPLTSLDNLKSL
jgi:hypothetical protein